ncbi:MAG: carboxypeptidase regulatory-like domain-containing protein [Saprospiraceae bacterium]|nr:carboxypeptidase regulatory-like domain-containing protein [Saprospiraceae bacterium]
MKVSLLLTSLWLALSSLFFNAGKTALTGKITDETGAALPGAAIKILKNRALIKAVLSDADGKYRAELEPDTYDVEFSYTGYATQRVTGVQIQDQEEKTLDITLEGGAVLNEVVVTGYSARRAPSRDAAGAPATGGEKDFDMDVAMSASGKIGDKPDSKPASRLTSEELRSVKTAPKSEKHTDSEKREVEAPAPEPTVSSPAESLADDEVIVDGVRKKARIAFDPETYEEKIILEDIPGAATAPPPPGEPAPRAGLLTAGEWNDLHNWNRHWLDLLTDGEIDAHENMYGFFPKQRYPVLLTNEQDFPIADAVVQLKSNGEIIWEARTDNTGKAELWADLFDPAPYVSPKGMGRLLTAEAWINDIKHDLGQPKPAKEGLNRFRIEAPCEAPKNVDIVWAVDATGSMGDEIEYLKTELLDVIGRAKGRNPDLSFRMGTVFYRDLTDAYITNSSALSYDIPKTVDFIKKQSADGGGDYPEAVHSALEEVVFGQKWNEHAIARICFLVLDASPHQSPEINASLQKSIREAARRGIRIVPVTASGIQKDTEFLMKFFGLATNGTYVFLTDHSGIGGKHLEPTTDEYKVEPLNELLVRLITEYSTIETCEGKSNIRFDPDQQQQGQSWQAQYYPNPASSQFVLDLPVEVQSVTIYDSEGKAVRKLEKLPAGQNTIVVSDLSEGFYTIRILKDGQLQSGKLMVIRA